MKATKRKLVIRIDRKYALRDELGKNTQSLREIPKAAE